VPLERFFAVRDVGSGDNLNEPLKTRSIPRGGRTAHRSGRSSEKSSYPPRMTQLLHPDLAKQPPRHGHTPDPTPRPKARLLLRGTSGQRRFLHPHGLSALVRKYGDVFTTEAQRSQSYSLKTTRNNRQRHCRNTRGEICQNKDRRNKPAKYSPRRCVKISRQNMEIRHRVQKLGNRLPRFPRNVN
jgi:hypothetical protein